MNPKKLGIVLSHPIQYYAPLFKVLSESVPLKVFYCHNPSDEEVGQDGFGKAFQWDIDLLSGYDYEFLENVAKIPSVSDYNGCDCPSVGQRLEADGITHVVVFGWYLKALKQTLNFCNKNKIPIACRGDSQLNPKQVWYKRLFKRLYYPFFLKHYNAFLYVGQRNKEYLKHYGVPENRLIFSPHAIDQEFWSGKKIPNEKFIFIWVAKFIEKKRPKDVINAFKSIDDQDLRLRMIGSGRLLDECVDIAADDDRIEFLGFKNQTELREEYLQADALVLTSNYEETWGLVVNEALSIGLPSIVSNACGCSKDLIIDGESGFGYELGNTDSLRNYLKTSKELLKSGNNKQKIKEINQTYHFSKVAGSFRYFINNY